MLFDLALRSLYGLSCHLFRQELLAHLSWELRLMKAFPFFFSSFLSILLVAIC